MRRRGTCRIWPIRIQKACPLHLDRTRMTKRNMSVCVCRCALGVCVFVRLLIVSVLFSFLFFTERTTLCLWDFPPEHQPKVGFFYGDTILITRREGVGGALFFCANSNEILFFKPHSGRFGVEEEITLFFVCDFVFVKYANFMLCFFSDVCCSTLNSAAVQQQFVQI